jgi:hypothetical protein
MTELSASEICLYFDNIKEIIGIIVKKKLVNISNPGILRIGEPFPKFSLTQFLVARTDTTRISSASFFKSWTVFFTLKLVTDLIAMKKNQKFGKRFNKLAIQINWIQGWPTRV